MRGRRDETSDALTRWALQAGRGDQLAVAAFVRASQAEVWRLLAHLTDPGAADDLTQETYLRAFRALPAFRGDASARTWLLSITRRVAADHLRAAARRPRRARGFDTRMDAPEPGSDPASHTSLRLLVDGLDPARREAFVLTQLLGLSYAEAAEACGVAIGTIRSRVARARGDLVAALRDTEALESR